MQNHAYVLPGVNFGIDNQKCGSFSPDLLMTVHEKMFIKN